MRASKRLPKRTSRRLPKRTSRRMSRRTSRRLNGAGGSIRRLKYKGLGDKETNWENLSNAVLTATEEMIQKKTTVSRFTIPFILDQTFKKIQFQIQIVDIEGWDGIHIKDVFLLYKNSEGKDVTIFWPFNLTTKILTRDTENPLPDSFYKRIFNNALGKKAIS